MSRIPHLLCVGAVAMLMASPALAKPISAPGAKRLLQIKGQLAQIQVNPKWATGNISEAEFDAAAKHARGVIQHMKTATQLWNSLGMWDKRSAEARPVYLDLKAKNAYQGKIATRLNAMLAKRRAAAGGGGAGANAPPPPPPSGLSRQSSYFIKNFDANYGRLRENPKFCAGDFGAGQRRSASNLEMAIARSMSFASRAAAKVPANERSVPAVKHRLDRLARLQACQKAIQARDKQLKAGAAVTKAQFFAFKKDASPYGRTVRHLITMLGNPKLLYTPNGEELKKWMADLDAVHKLCTTKYAGIENDPRYGFRAENNPEKWCELASKRDWVAKNLVKNYANSLLRISTREIKEATKGIEEHNGYIPVEAGFTLLALYKPAELKKNILGRTAPLFKTAGMAVPDGLFSDVDALVAAFWKKVDRLAPTWKSPRKEGGGQPVKAARAQLRKVKGVGKVLKAYTTRAAWKIHKNALGIPLRRSRPGYVQYTSKLRKPWCVSRGFTYTEEYTGRRYQKVNGVRLGYTRFMKCGK